MLINAIYLMNIPMLATGSTIPKFTMAGIETIIYAGFTNGIYIYSHIIYSITIPIVAGNGC